MGRGPGREINQGREWLPPHTIKGTVRASLLPSLTVGSEPGGPQPPKAEEISRVGRGPHELESEGRREMPAHLLPASWAQVLLRVAKRERRGLEIGTGRLGQG